MADKFIHFIPSIRRSLLSISAAWSLLLIFSLVSAQTLRLQFPDISNPFYKALFFAIFLSLIQQGITFYAADSIMLRKRQIALISLWLAAGWIAGGSLAVISYKFNPLMTSDFFGHTSRSPAEELKFLWGIGSLTGMTLAQITIYYRSVMPNLNTRKKYVPETLCVFGTFPGWLWLTAGYRTPAFLITLAVELFLCFPNCFNTFTSLLLLSGCVAPLLLFYRNKDFTTAPLSVLLALGFLSQCIYVNVLFPASYTEADRAEQRLADAAGKLMNSIMVYRAECRAFPENMKLLRQYDEQRNRILNCCPMFQLTVPTAGNGFSVFHSAPGFRKTKCLIGFQDGQIQMLNGQFHSEKEIFQAAVFLRKRIKEKADKSCN